MKIICIAFTVLSPASKEWKQPLFRAWTSHAFGFKEVEFIKKIVGKLQKQLGSANYMSSSQTEGLNELCSLTLLDVLGLSRYFFASILKVWWTVQNIALLIFLIVAVFTLQLKHWEELLCQANGNVLLKAMHGKLPHVSEACVPPSGPYVSQIDLLPLLIHVRLSEDVAFLFGRGSRSKLHICWNFKTFICRAA